MNKEREKYIKYVEYVVVQLGAFLDGIEEAMARNNPVGVIDHARYIINLASELIQKTTQIIKEYSHQYLDGGGEK